MNARRLSLHGANASFVLDLCKKGARFLVIGGTAVKFYVPARETSDLDILVDPTEETARTVFNCIVSHEGIASPSFGFHDLTEPKKQCSMKRHCNADVLTPCLQFDFDAAWTESTIVPFQTTQVRIASVRTLLELLDGSAEEKHKADTQMLRRNLPPTT